MNSFKKFFFSLTLLTLLQAFNILTANGQDSQQYDFSTVSINGLELDRYYTREQLIDALGVPDEEDDVVYSYFVYNSHHGHGPGLRRLLPERCQGSKKCCR